HEDGARDVLVLSGDQLYRMDYRELLKTHRENKADVTIAVLPVAADQAAQFGIVRLDDAGRVTGFVEKPKTREELEPWRTSAEWIEKRGVSVHQSALGGERAEVTSPRQFLASMGIYLFSREA